MDELLAGENIAGCGSCWGVQFVMNDFVVWRVVECFREQAFYAIYVLGGENISPFTEQRQFLKNHGF